MNASDNSTPREWVILSGKDLQWKKSIELGVLQQGGACIVTLADGTTARIGTQTLLKNWDENRPFYIEFHTQEGLVEVQVRADCRLVSPRHPAPKSQHSSASTTPATAIDPNMTLKNAEIAAACSFILLCMVMNLVYGVDELVVLHKACLTIGVLMSLATLALCLSKTSQNGATIPMKRTYSDGGATTLHYSIHLVGYRIDGQQYAPNPTN